MKITIEADTEGEESKAQTFEKVTQFIAAGSLIRQGIAPGTFRYCRVGDDEQINDMIGVLHAAIESLHDFKKKRAGVELAEPEEPVKEPEEQIENGVDSTN